MLCARCGEREVPVRKTGRPRRYCLTCNPSKWDGMDPGERRRYSAEVHARARQRAREHDSEALRQLAGRLSLLLHVLRLDAIANADADPRHDLCGCGRDYLTVPLEESHLCIRPVRRDSAA